LISFESISSNFIFFPELNPFLDSTGAALFSWRVDERVLNEGPFEFRFHSKPIEEISSMAEMMMTQFDYA